jgi:hypothetical protein
MMLKNMLLVLVSILISVLFIEAALRLIYTPRPLENRMKMVEAGLDSGDSTLRWESSRLAYQPLQSATVMHVEYRNTVTVDRYGFRNPCLKEPIEGIVVGDSSVFGIGVEDEETFQCSYARRGKNTYSMGVPGAPPSYLVRLVEVHGQQLKEAFAFRDGFFVQYVLSLGNDFAKLASFEIPNPHEAEEGTKPKRRGKPLSERANRLIYHDSLLRFSYVLQMLKLVAVSAAPQCKDCSYLDLRGGDRIYRATVGDLEAERHVDAIGRFFDTASDAARKAGAASVQFVLIRGAHIINKRRLDKELSLQGASPEEFNLNYQSDIIAQAASRRPEITVIDSTRCLQKSPQPDALHYQFDGHFTPLGIETFMNCLSNSGIGLHLE